MSELDVTEEVFEDPTGTEESLDLGPEGETGAVGEPGIEFPETQDAPLEGEENTPTEEPVEVETKAPIVGELFIGTKILRAVEMTLGDYNILQGWELPEGQDPETEGYLVEYLDGGQPNHPDFSGYISWSPEEVFEKAYRATTGMSFGLALEAAKMGMPVKRKAWANQTVVYFPRPERFGKTSSGKPSGIWIPTMADIFAEDWSLA